MTKKEILKHLYINTQEVFPIKLKELSTEFNGFIGKFYYFNAKTGESFDLKKTLADELDITVDDAIKAMNKNTKNDLIVLPFGNSKNFQLVDINGGHVEKILLNQKRLQKIFRAMNRNRLNFVPVNNFKWYITDSDISCGNDLTNIFKEHISTSYYFEIKFNGEISKVNLD